MALRSSRSVGRQAWLTLSAVTSHAARRACVFQFHHDHSDRAAPKRSAISDSVRSSCCTDLRLDVSGKRDVPSAAGFARSTNPLQSATGPEAAASMLTRPVRDQASAANARDVVHAIPHIDVPALVAPEGRFVEQLVPCSLGRESEKRAVVGRGSMRLPLAP